MLKNLRVLASASLTLSMINSGCAPHPWPPRPALYEGGETIVDSDHVRWTVGERVDIGVRMFRLEQHGSDIDITAEIISAYRGKLLCECELLDWTGSSLDLDGRIINGSVGHFSFVYGGFEQPSKIQCQAYRLTRVVE